MQLIIDIRLYFLTKINPGFSIFNRAGKERIINTSFVPARHGLRLRRGGRVLVPLCQIFLVPVYPAKDLKK
jgi:hypothetical protein